MDSGGGTAGVAVTDSFDTVYTAVGPWYGTSNIFYGITAESGPGFVTLHTPGDNLFRRIVAHEVSGVASFDVASPGSTVFSMAPTDTAIVTHHDGEYVFAAAMNSDGTFARDSFSVGGFFTKPPNATSEAGYYELATDYYVQPTAGSVQGAFTRPNPGRTSLRTATFFSSVADTTAPTVPTGLTATAVSSSSINLAWNPSTDPDNTAAQIAYNLYRNGTPVQRLPVGAVTYADTGLTAGTTYTYTVAAVDPAGNTSAQSAPVSATTQGTVSVPSAPIGLTAVAVSSTEIDLAWTVSHSATGYNVYRGGVKVGTSATVTFKDTALTPSTAQLLKAVEAVARIAHHLAGLAHIVELLGELQQADLGADDLLFSGHDGVLSNRRGGTLRHPDRSAPRLGYRCAVDQDTTVRLNLS